MAGCAGRGFASFENGEEEHRGCFQILPCAHNPGESCEVDGVPCNRQQSQQAHPRPAITELYVRTISSSSLENPSLPISSCHITTETGTPSGAGVQTISKELPTS